MAYYKEMIENVRICASGDCCGCTLRSNKFNCQGVLLASVGAIIEQLVKERDAAVANLEEDIKAIGKTEFLVKMCEAKYRNGGYEEHTHIDMDEIMCETLRSLGYEAGVAVFENTDKWYS